MYCDIYKNFWELLQQLNVFLHKLSFIILILKGHYLCDKLSTNIYSFLLYFQYWHDEQLKWNSSEYGGISAIQLEMSQIWHPDITLYNEGVKE